MRAPRTALAVLSLAAIACQSPDVGQRCELSGVDIDLVTPGIQLPEPSLIGGDLLQTFNVACERLTCIVSPVDTGPYSTCTANGQCGYCSKPCVSDRDCFTDETGLVCRQMVLDEAFIDYLLNSPDLTEAQRAANARMLSSISSSSYCAVPGG
jgi:hypothetical protein